MKTTLLLMTLMMTTSLFASRLDIIIDDLGRIPLMIDQNSIEKEIHYPNYRIGGGTPPRGKVNDCLILDIPTTDIHLSLADKMKLAKKLKVVDDPLTMGGAGHEMIPKVHNNKVVFLTRLLNRFFQDAFAFHHIDHLDFSPNKVDMAWDDV